MRPSSCRQNTGSSVPGCRVFCSPVPGCSGAGARKKERGVTPFEKKSQGHGSTPAVFRLVFHVVEDPVPDDHEAGDDDIGEQSCTEERPDDDEFVVHGRHPQASAGTLSAQVSTFARIASSSYEVRLIRSRPIVTL